MEIFVYYLMSAYSFDHELATLFILMYWCNSDAIVVTDCSPLPAEVAQLVQDLDFSHSHLTQ